MNTMTQLISQTETSQQRAHQQNASTSDAQGHLAHQASLYLQARSQLQITEEIELPTQLQSSDYGPVGAY